MTNNVIVFGSFDPLHQGHLDYFRQARALGDSLTVVVARDSVIMANKKPKVHTNQTVRLNAVKNAPNVDKAILGDEPGQYTIINKLKPDIIAIGYDQTIPPAVKNILKNYKIVKLAPYKPHKYKSSLLQI
ncbi:adenylyltransferase/cytidyltransferase family protein [Candidatus Saccharibacteria bacterium]|nr:adenylyltransferase/cytidyltransferase family protein [Candidatus Saccharibacteria bacterium]